MFSELIDDIITVGRRGGRQPDIISYANQTIRECQAHKQGAFDRDMVEDQVVVSDPNPTVSVTNFIWTRPPRFRKLRTVKISQIGYEDTWPKFKPPGKVQDYDTRGGYPYYYSADDYYVFAFVNNGANLNLAYYKHARRFQYYPANQRPATYDRTTETWSYLSGTTDPDAQATARDLVSNWLLLDYYDMIREGTLAKLYKSIGDNRAQVSYAIFKQLEADMVSNEVWTSLDF